MQLASIFALFGVKVDQDSFAGAFRALAALQVAAKAVSGIISIAHDLVDMAKGAAEAGTHVMGLAAGLGLSTKAVQEWSYVAQQAGSNADAFARGMSMFERNLQEFAKGRGSKAFRDGMNEMHISASNMKQVLNGPDGINAAMFQVADRYKEMGATAARGAINTRLFGARNREMAHDLGQGSEYIKAQIAHLHELGGVLSTEELTNLKKFDNSIKDIHTALDALSMSVVASLAPAFHDMLEEMAKWIAENRVMLGDLLRGAFEALAVAFKVLFAIIKALGAVVEGVMNGDVGMIALFSLAAGAVALLASAIIAMAVPAIIAMGTALWIAMAPLLPWSLALAAIIALVLLLATHWSETMDFLGEHWQLMLSFLLPIVGIPLLIIKHWETVKAWFSAFGAWFIGLLASLGEFLLNLIPGGDSWEDFKKGGGDAIDFLIEKAKNLALDLLNPFGLFNSIDMVKNITTNENTVRKPSVPAYQTKGGAGQVATNEEGAGQVAGAPAGRSATNSVSIGPTTINIHGVKDAQEAKEHIADSIDAAHRHAAAALGGEVQ